MADDRYPAIPLPAPGASGILNPNAGVGFFFSGPDGPPTPQELERRRQLLMARNQQKRGFPKNIGEGLTSLGEAFGDRMEGNRLASDEARYMRAKAADPLLPGGVASPPVGSSVAPRPSAELLDPAVNDQRTRLTALLTPGGGQGNPTEPGADTPPVTATGGLVSDDEPIWNARSGAIGGIESGGRYDSVSKAPTKYGHALGKYGVVEANVGPWTQAALGQPLTPAQFLQNPQAQDAVFKHRFGQYVNQYGEEGAARAWFGGPGNVRNVNATDAYGRLSVGTYGQDYLRRLQGAMGGATATSGAPGGADVGGIVTDDSGDPPNPPTPSTIQPMRVAQAGSMTVPGVLDPRAPEKAAPPSGIRPIDPNVGGPNAEPVIPQRQIDLTADEQRGWAIMRKYQGDPEAQALAKMLIDRGAKQREDNYLRGVEEYKTKFEIFKARKLAEEERAYKQPRETFEVSELKRKQQQEIEDSSNYPFGKDKALALSKESHEKVAAIPAAAVAIKGIRKILNSDAGMFTGTDAAIRANVARWSQALGLPYNEKLDNTQVFQNLVTPIIAALRPAIVGTGAQSLPEFKLLREAAGGDVKLERGAIERVMNAVEKLNHVAAVEHHKRLYANASEEKGRQVIFGNYQLPMAELVPQVKVNRLRAEIAKHGDNQEAIAAEMKQFNKDNYTDGLAETLLGR